MENTFYTEHILLRTNEIQDTIFGEHVPFSFFYSEKILCVGFPFFCEKKKDLKIGFLKYGNAGNTRRSVLTYIYIIYNIKRKERRKHHRDNYTHPFPSTFF